MDTNRLGCVAEYRFAVMAMQNGFNLSFPLMHSSPYDCVTEKDGVFKKIQIKSSLKKPEGNRSAVHIVLNNAKSKYTKDRVDYFAIWLEHFNGFFILKNTGNMQSIRLSIKGKYSKNFNNFAMIE